MALHASHPLTINDLHHRRSPSPPANEPPSTFNPVVPGNFSTQVPHHFAESEIPDNESASPTQSTTTATIDMEILSVQYPSLLLVKLMMSRVSNQILELDEDDDHEFSRGMVWAYFSQASSTFVKMDNALARKDLAELSSLGHFLKGSSAALGVEKVQESCEKIQHYGANRDEEKNEDLTDEAALKKIRPLLGQVTQEYAVAEAWLRQWYDGIVKTD